MDNSVSGINVKIGADLSDLKKKLGEVGDTVADKIEPAKQTVKSLADHFRDASNKARTVAQKALQIAGQVQQIANAMKGFVQGALEKALELHPETQEKINEVKDAFDNMVATLGKSLIPVIEQWAPKLETALDSITGWIEEHPEAAKNILTVVSAVTTLATAMGTAMPILVAFNTGLFTINMTTIAVVAAIGSLVLIIGMLIDKSDELTTHTVATAEGIENMDTASQSLVQNGYGDLEIWDNAYTEIFDPETGDYVMARWDEVTQSFVADSENLSGSAESVAEAVDGMNESTATTKTTAEEVAEILGTLNESAGALGDTVNGDLTEGLTTVNEILDSEGFKSLAQNPVSEDTIAGYQALADALGNANTAINGGEESTGLTGALTGIPALFDNARTAAESFANYLSTGFVAAIVAFLAVVCIASTDEEGNTNAGGGNTLYTALGAVYGLFCDLLATSQQIAQHWTGEFLSASLIMREEAGAAAGVITGLGSAAQAAADQFGNLAGQIMTVVAAYIALQRVKGNGSRGGGNTGKPFEETRASGGPVYSGSTYLVGEQGPELFTPRMSGTIIPNDELGGRGGETINVIFQGDVIGDEKSISAYVTKAVSKGIRRSVYVGA